MTLSYAQGSGLKMLYRRAWVHTAGHPVRLTSSPSWPCTRKTQSVACIAVRRAGAKMNDPGTCTSGTSMDPSQLASMLRIQNLIKLCKQLRLPVTYKVSRVHRQPRPPLAPQQAVSQPTCMDAEPTALCQQQMDGALQQAEEHQQQEFNVHLEQQQDAQQASIELAVVVHVLSDHAFKKYLQHCSASDLMLLRGMLLKVEVDATQQHVLKAHVQQAFLPKFENEGQDSSIADAIVEQADQRPMVITIKHSGSLVTLSHQGFAAKNSLDNDFTAGAALLLQTHFQRLLGFEQGLQRLQEFMDMLQEKRLAFSFEMVTDCHGHHGQIPAGEYLVTTSAHTVDDSGQTLFSSWQDLLQNCLEWGLPLNDTWIIQGSSAAAAARELLDHLALSGCTTSEVLDQLRKLSDQTSDAPDLGGDVGSVAGSKVSDRPRPFCIHLPGTYPHDHWQGSRIEGFVVSQGQGLETHEAWQGLLQTRERMAGQVLRFYKFTLELQKPYQHLLQNSGESVSSRCRVQSECSSWLPEVTYEPINNQASMGDRQSVVDLIEEYPVPLNTSAALQLPDGTKIFSRVAVESLSSQDLQEIVNQGTTATAAAAAVANGARALNGEPNPIQVMQMLAGPGHQQTSLRYKKKILMWSNTEVGYCMMTFVIRNGLTALRLSEMSYLSALGAMAKHSWRLPQALVEKVVFFGRCWARWLARHGGVSSVKESSYLDAAESFVQDFLDGVASDGSAARPDGSFQGIVMTVDVSERVVKQLQRVMHLEHFSKPNSGEIFFSKSLVRDGTILWLPADQGLPKNNFRDFIKAAVPYAYVVVQPPNASGDTPQAKKACGMHASKLRTLNSMLSGPGLLTTEQLEQRTYQLPKDFAESLPEESASQGVITVKNKGVKESNKKSNKRGRQDAPTEAAAPSQLAVNVEQTEACMEVGQVPESNNTGDSPNDNHEDVITDERLADVLKAVVDKFGSGSPPEQQDPAFVTCFVALPGIGKTVLVSKLKQLATNSSSSSSSSSDDSSSTTMSVEVLNSDLMKARHQISGMRYWHQVAGAADSSRGGGHHRLVLADKNLVPAPRDNIARVTDIINKSGATTIAVNLTCIPPPSQVNSSINPSSSSNSLSHPDAAAPATDQQQQQLVGSDVAFPPELLALCMLRVLQRQSHEGGLDASHAHAMSVVATFASYFTNMSSSQLRQQLLASFTHVMDLPVAALHADKQVPAAVLNHIAEGLSKVQINSDQQLPPEWESRMCHLLSDPDNAAAVAAIALPLDDCAARLQTAIAQIMHCSSSSSRGDAMQGVDPTPTAAAAAGLGRLDPRSGVSGDLQNLHLNLGLLNPEDHTAAAVGAVSGSSGQAAGVVRYVGVAVLHEEQLRQQLLELMSQLQQQQQQQEIFPTRIKSDLHVTLWHVDSIPGAAGAAADAAAAGAATVAGAAGAAATSLPTALMSVAGQEVQMQITGLDCSPQVTAAQVEILSGPDAVTQAWDNLAYPHITLLVAQGYNAVDSNQLAARVADANDVAFRVLLQEPLIVVGQVLPFE